MAPPKAGKVVPQGDEEGPPYSDTWPTTSATGYSISEHLLDDPCPSRPAFRIVLAGAGASGIDFLHWARQELEKPYGIELVCYEKNNDVGGTWLENKYPGCACDIPSVSYQFTWKSKPDWTHYYGKRQEIWEYFKGIVEEEGLGEYIKLQSEVRAATWNEETSKWILRVTSTDLNSNGTREWIEECDYFVNTTGVLNAWKWPEITGLHSFKGTLVHSARWDTSINLKNKTVAVIGSGSSGIQIVAEIQKDVKKLYTFARGPTWVTPGFAQKYAGENGTNFSYSEAQKKEFADDPQKYLEYRKLVESEMNVRFKFILNDTKAAADAKAFAYGQMCQKLGHDPKLIDQIVPKNFNVGCKRPSPGPGYLEALTAANTTLFTDNIGSITETGFLTADGTEVPVDIIVCATGFDTSFRGRFPIIGLDGKDVRDLWKDWPLSYLSLGIPRIPNYFIYIGPYGPQAHGSIMPIIEVLTQYLIRVIKKMRREHIRRLSPSVEATNAFGEHASLYMQRTAWTGPCRSWFKQGTRDGPVVMWPGSRLHFFNALSEPRFEDYEIEYFSGNRFGYFGNGFAKIEFQKGADLAYYMGGVARHNCN